MKLNDMRPRTNLKRMNKVLESRFGFTLDYSKLTVDKAMRLSHKLSESLSKIRKSHGIHTAERNPKYLEFMMVKESLDKWLSRRRLNEGELGQAEVILAAKSMVDTLQDMIEKIGKLQNEELPPLLDAIRDQIGTQQADTFKQQASDTLTSALTQLNACREELDSGARMLAGEEMPTDMSMPGQMPADPTATPPPGTADDMAVDPNMPADNFAAADAAAGGASPVGRDKR